MAKYSYETQAPPKAPERSTLSMNSRVLLYSMAAVVVAVMFWYFYG